MHSSLLQGSSNKRAQWSDLPPELLPLISHKLSDISDYIRFRCVSRSCRSSAPIDMSPKLPWMMLPADLHSPTRSFFSLPAKKVYTLHLPELSGKVICGSSCGWLIALNVVNPESATAFLFNPVTRAKIQLPPPVDLPRQLGLRVEKLEAQHYIVHQEQAEAVPPEHFSELGLVPKAYIEQASLSSSLSSSTMVLAVLPDSPKFAFCCPGDDNWTVLDSNLPLPVAAIVYRKTQLYIVDVQGNTAVCNLSRGITTLIHSLEIPDNSGFHILELPNEELQLVVFTFLHNEGGQSVLRVAIRIFGLDIEQLKLSETTSMDNHHAIFLNFPMCTPTGSSYPGFKENCIYFPCLFEVRPSQNRSCFDIECITPNLAIYQYSIHNNQVIKHLLSNWKQPDSRSLTRSCWVTPTL